MLSSVTGQFTPRRWSCSWLEIPIVSLLLASYRLSPPGDELGRGTGQGEEQPAGQVMVPVVAG